MERPGAIMNKIARRKCINKGISNKRMFHHIYPNL